MQRVIKNYTVILMETSNINKEKRLALQNLKDKFEENIKQYKSTLYDESNIRVDFIDKFFETLDWDIRNDSGYSEQYKEVVR